MNINDTDVISAKCFSDGVLFKVETDKLIDQKDYDGLSIFRVSVLEVQNLLSGVVLSTETCPHPLPNMVFPEERFYLFNPSSQESLSDMYYTVLLVVDQILNDSVFLTVNQLTKMSDHYTSLVDQWNESEVFDQALKKHLDSLAM